MKDEINIKMPGQILDYVDTKEHLLELFNYITNLQKKLSLAENIVYDYLYKDKKITKELYDKFKGGDKDVKD